MTRILVTGASGFIGSHIAQHFHAQGHDVLATGRDIPRLQFLAGQGMATRACDLADASLSALTDGIDAVVHCAALSSPWGRREDFMSANVLATERLLDASRQSQVGRFIHFSSPSIYFCLGDQFDRSEAFDPPERWINAYAETKWLAEDSVRAAVARGLPAMILRPRAVFGEGDRSIFPRLLGIARRGWFPRIGDGEALIDVTYVANVVAAVQACMQDHLPGDGRALNITNGEPISVKKLLQKLFSAMELRVRMFPMPRRAAIALGRASEVIANVLPGQPEPLLSRYGVGLLGFSQTLDISAARQQLGYAPTVSVDEGIDRFAHWWKTHGSH